MDDACSPSLLSIGVKLSSRKPVPGATFFKKGNEHLLHVFLWGEGDSINVLSPPWKAGIGWLDPKSR